MSLCTNTSFFHKHTDHKPELTNCDICKNMKKCIVMCEAPKHKRLHKKCNDCRIKQNEEQQKKNEESLKRLIESIDRQ